MHQVFAAFETIFEGLDWRELMKVPSDDNLYPAKGLIRAASFLHDGVESFKVKVFHHFVSC